MRAILSSDSTSCHTHTHTHHATCFRIHPADMRAKVFKRAIHLILLCDEEQLCTVWGSYRFSTIWFPWDLFQTFLNTETVAPETLHTRATRWFYSAAGIFERNRWWRWCSQLSMSTTNSLHITPVFNPGWCRTFSNDTFSLQNLKGPFQLRDHHISEIQPCGTGQVAAILLFLHWHQTQQNTTTTKHANMTMRFSYFTYSTYVRCIWLVHIHI